MASSNQHPLNTFGWPELCTSDIEGAKRFYTAMFGWTAEDMHMPEGDYTIFRLQGDSVAGGYQVKPERIAAGVKPHWNTYVSVGDIQETVKAIADAGGKITMGPVDAGGNWMANAEDSTGVKFCLWQGAKDSPPSRLMELNAMVWNELYSQDVEKSKAFYNKALGWTTGVFEASPKPYWMFNSPTAPHPFAGMMELTPDMQGFAAQWLPYIQVQGTDAFAAKVAEQGGKNWFPPMDIPTVGRIAMFSDPQGAGLAVITVQGKGM